MRKIGKRKFRYNDIAMGEWRCGGNFIRTLERDNYSCAICGSNGFPIVHHLDGNIRNNRSNNLLTVCRKCHAELHGLTFSIKKPRNDFILELRAQRKTFQEIGDYLGISRQRVHQILKNIAY